MSQVNFNNSVKQELTEISTGAIFQSLSLAFVGLLVFLTNISSLIIIWKQNDVFGEATRLFYTALGAVDLIGGLTGCVFFSVYFIGSKWPFDFQSCQVVHWFYICCLGSSATILSCISSDRYLAITRPFKYHRWITPRRAKVWLTVTMLIPLTIFSSGLVPSSPMSKLSSYMCYTPKERTVYHLSPHDRNTIVIAFSFAVLPVWIGIALNVSSMMISVRQERALAAQLVLRSSQENPTENRRMQYKGVKTIFLISLVNVITWLPAMVRLSYPLFREEGSTDDIPTWLDHTLLLLTLTNFWSNAPIFARTNVAYRNSAKTLFRSLFCQHIPRNPRIVPNQRVIVPDTVRTQESHHHDDQ